MAAKVALVTGGNKGIGFELCRLLCKQFKETNGTVILTARDEPSGQSACSKLIADGYQACFIPLDVTSKISIHNAAVKIKSEYSGLDILINNAGVMYSSSKSKNIPYADQVEKTLSTNFNGVLRMCETMLPLMKRNSRIVNVTSRLGSMKLYGKEIQSKICSKNLDRDGLVDLMMQYSSKVKSNTHLEAGWPKYEPDSWIPVAYCVSKLAVTVLTRILANECQTPGVLINCCCPGWCKSGLGGESAPKSAESGAVDILNVLSHDTNGVYWEDGQMKLNDLSSQAPMVRLQKVAGHDDKCNDIVFCGEDAMQHVVFFPGDVQNYGEEMERIKENKPWKDWDLESTAQILFKRFPRSFIWVIRTAIFDRSTFACYPNFIEMDACGTPVFERADSSALVHLHHLLDSGVRKVLDLEADEEDVTSEFPIILVGFSKGCMVLNQIAYELPRLSITNDVTLTEFVSRFDAMYWLDGGNGGQANAYVTDEDVLFHLAHNVPKVYVHVTPYQVRDEARPWIRKEEGRFVAQLKSLGIDIKEKVHFADKKASLANHFRVLGDFKSPVPTLEKQISL